MSKTLSEAEKREILKKLVSDFDTAMLVTQADGGMRARPLGIAEQGENGELYFSTGIESPKVAELEADAHVCVTMQDKQRFVSLTGTARILKDRALIERLWSESWRIWFPDGKDDPSLCLLVVNPSEAAYWDSSGATGLKYLFEMAKAYVTGMRPDTDDDDVHTARVKT